MATSEALWLTAQQQRALAEQLRRGEPSAEDELCRLFSDRVSSLARSRTHDPEGARDVTQEVMFAVVCALRNGNVRETQRLAAFVYGTARNLINNHLRARGRRKEDPINDAFDTASQSDPVDKRERAVLVRRALEALDSTDRKILLLTLVEGLKPGEIASRLSLTPEVVRTRKSRAVKRTTEYVKRLSRTARVTFGDRRPLSGNGETSIRTTTS